MITPSIEELTAGKYNRYTLVVATAKCARMVTEEYAEQHNVAERILANKETDRFLSTLIGNDYRDEKAVKIAIKRLQNGTYQIVNAPEADGTIKE